MHVRTYEIVGETTKTGGHGKVEAGIYQVPGEERYEYALFLVNRREKWDSNVETYNGLQSFNRSQATENALIALAEIEDGAGSCYFDAMKED